MDNFENQFMNNVELQVGNVAIPQRGSVWAKVALAAGAMMSIFLVVFGVVAMAVPDFWVRADDNSAEIARLQTEAAGLRTVESEILSEQGFSAEYYAALENTSAVMDQIYALEDEDEDMSPVPNIKLAVILFVGAVLMMAISITIFIKA